MDSVFSWFICCVVAVIGGIVFILKYGSAPHKDSYISTSYKF